MWIPFYGWYAGRRADSGQSRQARAGAGRHDGLRPPGTQSRPADPYLSRRHAPGAGRRTAYKFRVAHLYGKPTSPACRSGSIQDCSGHAESAVIGGTGPTVLVLGPRRHCRLSDLPRSVRARAGLIETYRAETLYLLYWVRASGGTAQSPPKVLKPVPLLLPDVLSSVPAELFTAQVHRNPPPRKRLWMRLSYSQRARSVLLFVRLASSDITHEELIHRASTRGTHRLLLKPLVRLCESRRNRPGSAWS